MARRLLKGGHTIVAFATDPAAVAACAAAGATGAAGLELHRHRPAILVHGGAMRGREEGADEVPRAVE